MSSPWTAALRWMTLRRARREKADGWCWGRPSPRRRDLGQVAILSDLADETVSSAERIVDDRSFSDLEIDKIFHHLDRTASSIGCQTLYRTLRYSRAGAEPASREPLIRRLSEDASLRSRVGHELAALDTDSSWYLPTLLWQELPRSPVPLALLHAYAAVLPALLVAGIWLPWVWLLAIVPFLVNVVISNRLEAQIASFVESLADLPKLILTAKKLERLVPLQLRSALDRVPARLSRRAFTLGLTSNQLADSMGVLEYVNALTLMRLRAFYSLSGDLIRAQEALREIFMELGELDVALSIGSLRAGSDQWHIASIRDGASLQVREMGHPLLAEAVPNSVDLDDQGLLLTGLNMSGKSTFLKALGINALLAQTLNTVHAAEWHGPPMRVRASFDARDNLEGGVSLFLAEAGRALELLSETDGGRCLYLLDEPFRGTSTVERIAATAEVLRRLHDGHFVVAASHDLELANQLQGRFSMAHFRTRVDRDRVVFDYVLAAGPPATQTSVQLMGELGYPPDFLEGDTGRADALRRG